MSDLVRRTLPNELYVNRKIVSMAQELSFQLGCNLWAKAGQVIMRYASGESSLLAIFLADSKVQVVCASSGKHEFPNQMKKIRTDFIPLECRTKIVRQVIEHKLCLDDVFLCLIWGLIAKTKQGKRLAPDHDVTILNPKSRRSYYISVTFKGITATLLIRGTLLASRIRKPGGHTIQKTLEKTSKRFSAAAALEGPEASKVEQEFQLGS